MYVIFNALEFVTALFTHVLNQNYRIFQKEKGISQDVHTHVTAQEISE